MQDDHVAVVKYIVSPAIDRATPNRSRIAELPTSFIPCKLSEHGNVSQWLIVKKYVRYCIQVADNKHSDVSMSLLTNTAKRPASGVTNGTSSRPADAMFKVTT